MAIIRTSSFVFMPGCRQKWSLVHADWSWRLFWLQAAGRSSHVPLDCNWSWSERKYHWHKVRAIVQVADGVLLCVAVRWQPSKTREGISQTNPIGPVQRLGDISHCPPTHPLFVISPFPLCVFTHTRTGEALEGPPVSTLAHMERIKVGEKVDEVVRPIFPASRRPTQTQHRPHT